MSEENTQEQAQAVAEATAVPTPEPTPELAATTEPTPEVATEEVTLRVTSDTANVMGAMPNESVISATLAVANVGLQFGVEALTDANAKIAALTAALENCRLYAAKRPKEEWARHILGFCAQAGVTGSPLRG